MRTCTKCGVTYEETGFYGTHPHCRICQRKTAKQYYYDKVKPNPEKRRAHAKKWRDANRELYRANQNNYHARRRLKILEHYSKGKSHCRCCGETEIQFLSIDHIDGGGLQQGRDEGFGRGGLSAWIIRNGYPKGFQILCHNCNFAKGHYGQCPHNLTKGTER